MKEEFAEGVKNKCDGNEDWCVLKRKLLDVASEVCGYTKGKPMHFQTWWWNKDMWMWLCVERESYLEFGSRARMRKIGKKYCEAKRDAKRVVYMAMNQKA